MAKAPKKVHEEKENSVSEEVIENAGESSVEAAVMEPVGAADFSPVDEPVKAKSSFASKALKGLVLLLIGGALALFGGPKVAPYLPSGMKPVADFLTPGQIGNVEAVAQLEERLNAMESAQATLLDKVENPAPMDTSAIDAKIEGLGSQVSDVDAKMTAMDASINRVSGSVTALVDRLNEVSASGDGEISQVEAALAAMRAQLDTLNIEQSSIDQKLADVSAKTVEQVEQAQVKIAEVQKTAKATVDDLAREKLVAEIAASIESGADYSSEIASLLDGGVDIPDILTDAPTVPSLATLKTEFSDAAHAALRVDAKETAGDGIGNKLSAFFKSQVSVRSLEPQEGDGADAVLSRVQGFLDSDQLSEAVSEAQGLNGGSKTAIQGWLDRANSRINILDALATLSVK